MSRAVLFDSTICIGCRGCQVACKEENHNPAEKTEFFAAPGGYQNPPGLSAKTFTLLTYHELADAQGNPQWVFVRRQCMHCIDAACVAKCPEGAMQKAPDGTTFYEQAKCIGCETCLAVCPFEIPVVGEDESGPHVWKCTFCLERVNNAAAPDVLNEGHRTPDVLDEGKKARHLAHRRKPACVAACPTGALRHGNRDALLQEAHKRIREHPERYVDHVYGETEAGGTAWLYLAAVPFADLGFPTRFEKRSGAGATPASAWASQLPGVSAVVGGLYWYTRRRERIASSATADAEKAAPCCPSSSEQS